MAVNGSLIMKVNWTSFSSAGGADMYYGDIIKTYQGDSDGLQVATQAQFPGYPCLTEFMVNKEYITTTLPNAVLRKPEEPDCFFIALDMCSYFKLVSELTAEEKALLGDV
eukprot:CAMPEP_0168520334 /NCGR_PEP_ID=MMETSP0405-20121227/7906_1 /TAXON_ID=498012 /ORGANISM="Trichosphaerium sp, Strain Am-I-7 wt" /LENGTH=109 /DNA_ID=CAMNT_0008541157 /DNA_START=336 /DNA_END=665 /DNA_ORIENTATION=-